MPSRPLRLAALLAVCPWSAVAGDAQNDAGAPGRSLVDVEDARLAIA